MEARWLTLCLALEAGTAVLLYAAFSGAQSPAVRGATLLPHELALARSAPAAGTRAGGIGSTPSGRDGSAGAAGLERVQSPGAIRSARAEAEPVEAAVEDRASGLAGLSPALEANGQPAGGVDITARTLGLVLAVLLHLAASLVAAAATARAAIGAAGTAAILPLAAIAFLCPLPGPVGLELISRAWHGRGDGAAKPAPRQLSLDPLLAPFDESSRPQAPADLSATLAAASDRDRRRRALLASRALGPREAIALAEAGLKDPDDEIRLLAYALLQKHEQGLQERLGSALRAVESRPDDPSGHREVAEVSYALCDLGLARGAMRRRTLERARDHGLVAWNAGVRPPELALLLGRVLLALDQPQAAEAALRYAVAARPTVEARLALAEAAFTRRHFGEVGRRLHQIDRAQLSDRTALALMEAWS